MPNTTQYYKSIEKLAEETLSRYGKATTLDFIQVGVFLLVLFSVLPAIPDWLQSSVPEKYGPRLAIAGHSMPLDSLLLWWVFCATVSIALFALVSKIVSRRDTKLKKRLLSQAQLRFALAYGISDEISRYRMNKREAHLEQASHYLQRLPRFLNWTSFGSEGQHVVVKTSRPFPPISPFELLGHLPTRFRWFKLDPDTEKIVSAFQKFSSRFADRVKDRRDLPLVEESMRSLADYFYTEIPEITEDSSNQALSDWGRKKILHFSDLVNAASEYTSENSAPKKTFVLVRFAGTISALFQHPNTLLCFFSWYLLCLLIAIIGFWCVFRIFSSLHVDTAVVAGLVIGPITAAAAIVAISKPRSVSARG